MEENSYFAFAERDYRFFLRVRETGTEGGTLAALGQNICERYLKHIVELYAKPEDELGTLEKESVLRTHSLHRLIRYLKEKMGLKIQEHTEECLKKIAVFFTATMEPGDNSFLLSEEDIEDAWEAVLQTKGVCWGCDLDNGMYIRAEKEEL